MTLKYAGSKKVASVIAKVTTAVASAGNITVYFTDALNYGDVHIHY